METWWWMGVGVAAVIVVVVGSVRWMLIDFVLDRFGRPCADGFDAPETEAPGTAR